MTLTAQGFVKKRYEDFVLEKQELAKQLFGADVNLSDSSPMGQWIKLHAYADAEQNELAEQVYYSASYELAEGVALDRVVKNNGITRLPGQKATGTIRLTVTNGLTIEAGFLVGTIGEVIFKTIQDETDTDNDGFIDAAIEAVEIGPIGNVPANTIVEINTPLSGVNDVINLTATTGGRNAETDTELRNRYALSIAKGGSSTVDSIRAKMLSIPGVRAAIVIENDSHLTDVDGRPPNCFETILLGGTAEEVGQALLESKPGGIRAYGTETVIVKDNSGQDKTLGYSVATQKDVYVTINITKNSSFPTNGADVIKLELLKYIGGTDTDGNSYAGLGMGEDVILSKLFSLAYSSPGVSDVTIETSSDGITFNAANIALASTEVAVTDLSKLVINIV